MADALADIRSMLAPLGAAGWVVGGALRDAALGVPVGDVDVALEGDVEPAARRLASATGADRFPLSSDFGSWRLTGGRLQVQVDITPVQGADIHADLARRDFTVNAMALDLGDGRVVDPHGGAHDLAARRLRAVGPRSLDDDPVRVLRAVRLAQRHGLTVESGTLDAAARVAPRLWECPGERIRAELVAMARLDRADVAFAALDDAGALAVLVPQLGEARGVEQNVYHHKDVLGHTLEVVTHACDLAADPGPVFRGHSDEISGDLAQDVGDDASRREVLVLAALLHDMAKPATRDVTPEGRVTFMGHDVLGAEMASELLGNLRFSHRVRDAVAHCVRRHLVLGFMVHRQPLRMRQIDAFYRAVDRVDTESLILSAADRLATRGPRSSESQLRRHLRLVYELADQRTAWRKVTSVPPVLRGHEIAAILGRAPGPWLGEMVEALRVAQVTRPDMSARHATRLVREWGSRTRP